MKIAATSPCTRLCLRPSATERCPPGGSTSDSKRRRESGTTPELQTVGKVRYNDATYGHLQAQLTASFNQLWQDPWDLHSLFYVAADNTVCSVALTSRHPFIFVADLRIEATVTFLLEELQAQSHSLSKDLQKYFQKRILEERCNKTSLVLQYLHNPQAQLEK
ncbi:hypothetical protein LAZ67_18002352 [Cordylochernes scorpioides]|uniref:Uncharacterized protein n=1 Tax=Cordylochernes scorpioides TaxID=51811 RepID=A0ABY6LGJ7_9ARAC|nr:hypothetical protein LAZ67_18002352 [Cordylochernes scorpioides]